MVEVTGTCWTHGVPRHRRLIFAEDAAPHHVPQSPFPICVVVLALQRSRHVGLFYKAVRPIALAIGSYLSCTMAWRLTGIARILLFILGAIYFSGVSSILGHTRLNKEHSSNKGWQPAAALGLRVLGIPTSPT